MLTLSVEHGSALIDAGALMAGMSNRAVADRLVQLIPPKLQGVVYFDAVAGAWHVLSRHGRRWPKESSPIHERDAFVYFDESRCRGADMKLLPSAIAILTIGPGMCKDKFMQGAARLRMLDRGQKLLYLLTPEIASKIRSTCAIGKWLKPQSRHLLQWCARVPSLGASLERRRTRAARQCNGSHNLRPVLPTYTRIRIVRRVMKNTIQATADGLIEWAGQGSHYCTTQDPSLRLFEEKLELPMLYSEPVHNATVRNQVEKVQCWYLKRLPVIKRSSKWRDNSADLRGLSGYLQLPMRKLMRQILERATEFGSDIHAISTGVEDEECERELENEKELERETERQLPLQEPLWEDAWNFGAVLSAGSPEQLPPQAKVTPLATALRDHGIPELSPIGWELCGIYVTRNFVRTVCSRETLVELKNIGEYLRPVDMVVLFPKTSKCLLLSEYEADEVLSRVWARPPGDVAVGNSLGNLAYLRAAADAGADALPCLQVPLSRPSPAMGRNFFSQLMAWGQHSPDRATPASLAHSPAIISEGEDARLGEVALAGLQLFAGDTMFDTDARVAAMHELLRTHAAKHAALRPAALRGKQHYIPRSKLELICAVDIGEA